MTDLRKAAQMALEALDGVLDTYGEPLDLMTISGGTYEALECRDAITALRAALAQPEQEPVAWINEHGHIDRGLDAILEPTGWTPLYTARPQRKPLTEEEIEYLAPVSFTWRDMVTFARMIEHEHGIGGEE